MEDKIPDITNLDTNTYLLGLLELIYGENLGNSRRKN